MRSFTITRQKIMMQHLLTLETFDRFILAKASVVKQASLTLEGSTDPSIKQEYGIFRSTVYSFIKGSETPSYMKFVLLAPQNPQGVSSRSLNILYRDSSMTVTSGISMETFTLDRAPDDEWDASVERFLNKIDVF